MINIASFSQEKYEITKEEYLNEVLSDTGDRDLDYIISVDVKINPNETKRLTVINEELFWTFQQTRKWSGKEYVFNLKKELLANNKIRLNSEEVVKMNKYLSSSMLCKESRYLSIDSLREFVAHKHSFNNESMRCAVKKLFENRILVVTGGIPDEIETGTLKPKRKL